VVRCVARPAYFAGEPPIVRPRQEAYTMTSETRRLHWIILVDDPANIQEMLPDDWGATRLNPNPARFALPNSNTSEALA